MKFSSQPYGRGCFVFENGTMQHGHYVHQKDPNYQQVDDQPESVIFYQRESHVSIMEGGITHSVKKAWLAFTFSQNV